MRGIKFDLVYKGDTGFHHKKYFISEIMCGINKICDFHSIMGLIAIRQYTGLKDKNGVEIYEGDFINVFYTSNEGEHNHDCIYQVKIGMLGIELEFISLMWEYYGYNQYPHSTTLKERYESLSIEYNEKENKSMLCVPDSYGENHITKKRWKINDKSFYFEVIGNIYENPELLNQ